MIYVHTEKGAQYAFVSLADALSFIEELINAGEEVTITIYYDPKEVI